MAKDALGTHSRDELGNSDTLSARPVQAALASAGTFAVGAALPLLLVPLVPTPSLIWTVSGASLIFLSVLGGLAARAGGSPVFKSVVTRDLLGRAGHGANRRVGHSSEPPFDLVEPSGGCPGRPPPTPGLWGEASRGMKKETPALRSPSVHRAHDELLPVEIV